MTVEINAKKKPWNGKKIETANQWRFNDGGSKSPYSCAMSDILASYYDAKASDEFCGY